MCMNTNFAIKLFISGEILQIVSQNWVKVHKLYFILLGARYPQCTTAHLISKSCLYFSCISKVDLELGEFQESMRQDSE